MLSSNTLRPPITEHVLFYLDFEVGNIHKYKSTSAQLWEKQHPVQHK